MAMRSSSLVLFTLMALVSALIVPSTGAEDLGFTCSSTSTCNALIDYVSPNKTTLSGISTLFTVSDAYNLLGANSLPVSTKLSDVVAANSTIKIPFPCTCSNGSGISNRVPIYTVVSGDGLDHIARNVYSGLVTYQQIAKVNNITNVNLIEIGQKLWIPLPCSCDEVNEAKVVHYGHVVTNGSSVEAIAAEYGTDSKTLLNLNGLSNSNELVAGEVIDVPLKVCSSSINSSSADYGLLVPNGTYALTAYHCVQCSCNSAYYNYTLQCKPSGVQSVNLTECPSMQCHDGSIIGNSTSTCSTCTYAGYRTTNIFTTLGNYSCSGTSNQNNHAPARMGSQGLSWRVLLVTIHLGLLCFGLLS